ncbi:MAG: SusC/RagA family TonB-linked outer membrane protein [Arcicella sp.]|nr:SusC/RagA family TonB-linked outer membrane protein [Arcicella sp.]
MCHKTLYDLLDASTFLSGVTKAGGDANEVNRKANTNWQDEIFRTSLSQNYDLSYGSGNENTRYRVGVGFSDQQGIIKKSGLSRLTGRINLTQELFNDKLILDLTLTGSSNKNTYAPISDNAGFQGSLVGAAIQANPTYPVLNPDGTFFHPGGDFRNPAAMLAYIDDSDNITRYLANVGATYKLTPDLSYKFTLGLDNSSSVRNTWMDKRLLGYTDNTNFEEVRADQVSGNGRGIIQNRALASTLVEHTLTYDKKMGKGALNALVGYSYQNFTNYGYNDIGFGVKTGDVATSLDGYSKKIPTFGDSTRQQLQSYFARVNYSIADKYFLTGTVRADGSSKFGENNKYGVFPAFAFKWKLMNEAFIPKDIFNDLSFRLNWGRTGNQEFPGGVAGSISQRKLNGSSVPINAANPNIKWETTTQYGAGIDFAILQGKLSGTIDYFNKSTIDPIFLANYAQPAAVSRRWVNLPGTIKNTGFEVGLTLQAVQSKSFTWEILANATSLKNIIEDFGDGNVVTGDINGQGLSGAYVQTIRNGYPLFSFFLPTFSGFDQNGFAILPNDNRFNVEGSAIPTFTWGLTNNFTFGRLNASIFINGSSGNFLYNNTANALFTKGSLKNGRNVTTAVANSTENAVNPPEVSTRFLEKGDFIRLSNLSLGYTFNMPTSSKIKTLTVNLAGQNLLLISDYSGLDPEVNTNKARNDVPSLGIDYTAYPSARTFTFGVNLGF